MPPRFVASAHTPRHLDRLVPALDTAVSRRAALRRLGGGGLAAGLLLTGGHRPVRLAAQGGARAAVPPLLIEWAAAWSSHDPARLTALYAEDADLDDVAAGAVFRGRDAVFVHVAEIHAAFPDVVLEATSGFVAGDRAAAQYSFRGTYTGRLPGLPSGGGQAVSLRGVTLLELVEGRIRREAHYYDSYTFLVQLGVLPAPGAEGLSSP